MDGYHPTLPFVLRGRAGERIVIRGELVSIRSSASNDNYWAAAEVARDEDGARVRFVGADLPVLRVGAMVRVDGIWEHDDSYGWRVRASRVTTDLPRVADAVIRYLAANVDGCGMTRAAQIVTVLGASCLPLLTREPERVRAFIPGGAGVRIEEGLRAWAVDVREQRHTWHLTVRLLELGLTESEVRLVHRYFREADVAMVAARHHPYRLLGVPGIGWKTVDRIARKLDIAADHASRLEAALQYALSHAATRGHTGLPRHALVGAAARLCTSASHNALDAAASRALAQRELLEVGDVVTLPELHDAEQALARVELVLARFPRSLSATDAERVAQAINDSEVASGHALAPDQRAAVLCLLSHGTAVLTGRPGSGKTTVLRTFVACCRALNWTVRIAAPTGKAAARATEVTGVEASTVHRLLGGSPTHPSSHGLTADVVVVDEASMCDLETASWLASAIDPEKTRLIWTGDVEQLPSVGPGAVLRDLIASERIPVARLTTVFRQAAESRITRNAHALLDGQRLTLDDVPGGDWRFSDVSVGAPTLGAQAARAHDTLLNALQALASDKVNLALETQVLAPMRGGPLGVDALNVVLQRALNPDGRRGPDIANDARVRVGDRVIVTRNLYDLADGPLYNGEQAMVSDVSLDARSVTIDVIDGSPRRVGPRTRAPRRVTLRGGQRKLLLLGWAITVHRAQGSEYPYAFFCLHHEAHRSMLDARILYTAMTRATRLFHLIGTVDAIEAVRSGPRLPRYTSLAAQMRAMAPTVDA